LSWSRAREARADRFSLQLTHDPANFATAMAKLHDQNLGVADPRTWENWLFYSHAPGRERVELARAFRGSPAGVFEESVLRRSRWWGDWMPRWPSPAESTSISAVWAVGNVPGSPRPGAAGA